MNAKVCGRKSERALTLVEVLVMLVVVFLLVILLLPTGPRAKGRPERIACINNLKQIGLTFRQWSADQSADYPMSVSTNYSFNPGSKEYIATGEVFQHFRMMSNELNTTKILICPADSNRKPALDFLHLLSNSNVSYFVGVDAAEIYPSMFLAGDRNLTNEIPLPPNHLMELTSNSVVGWTKEMHKYQGNICLSDGSVQSLTSGRLQPSLFESGVATNRLAMPVE